MTRTTMTRAGAAAARVALAAALLLLGTAGAQAAEAVSVRLKWLAQGQFAGFYVAKEKGYYGAEGLSVTINPGGPNLNPESLAASGADQFALAGGVESLLAARDKGLPLICIAMMLQDTPSVYVAHGGSGIASIKDLKGRKVSTFFTGAQNTLFTVLAKAGLKQDEVSVVPQGVTLTPFLDKQVDAATVMLYNEYNTLIARGIKDLVVMRPEEYGVSVPSDTIVVSERFAAEKPAVVQAFLTATLRGWKQALRNPDEAVDILLTVAPGLERPHQRAMVETYGKLMQGGAGATRGLGVLDVERLAAAQQILVERKALSAPHDLSKAFVSRWWDAVPDADKKL